MPPSLARSLRRVAPGGAAGALAACGAPLGPGGDRRDARTCPQTSEFGNTGCVEFTGRVVGARGQPLADVRVHARDVPGRRDASYASGAAITDTAGAFRFRAFRMAGAPPAAGPDTVSLYVVGVDPSTAGLNTPARVRDSLLVQATVSPVGAAPVPTPVRLPLPAP